MINKSIKKMYWSISEQNNVWLFRAKYGDSWATVTFPLGANVKKDHEKTMLVGICSGETPAILSTIVLSDTNLQLIISDSYGQECLNITYNLNFEAYNELLTYVNNLPRSEGNQLVAKQY